MIKNKITSIFRTLPFSSTILPCSSKNIALGFSYNYKFKVLTSFSFLSGTSDGTLNPSLVGLLEVGNEGTPLGWAKGNFEREDVEGLLV